MCTTAGWRWGGALSLPALSGTKGLAEPPSPLILLFHGNGEIAIHLPTLVIHGQADRLIPVSEGVALYEGSGASDDEKRLVVIPGAGHNNLLALGAATYFEAIREFVLGSNV
jgi:pimeloyl-ACP methyl ester carboxylesterase